MADRRAYTEAAEIDRVAAEMREKAVVDVVRTEREVERARTMARVSQVVDYAFFIVYALLGVRLLMPLLAARPDAGFVQWINAVSAPLYAPFGGIFPSLALEGGYVIAVSVAFAIAIYAVAHALVRGLLRMVAHRRTVI
jgi:hypothetical protein